MTSVEMLRGFMRHATREGKAELTGAAQAGFRRKEE